MLSVFIQIDCVRAQEDVSSSHDLIGALAGGGTPSADLTTAAPLLLQTGTVTVLVQVWTGVGCRRQRREEKAMDAFKNGETNQT